MYMGGSQFFALYSSAAVGLRCFFMVALLQRFGKCMAAACATSAGLFVAKKGRMTCCEIRLGDI